MIQVIGNAAFFELYRDGMFHVGVLQSDEGWFPLCLVSDPDVERKLDTLFVSTSMRSISETLENYRRRIPGVRKTLINCVTLQEIQHILEFYGLKNVALISLEADHNECGCGCGCG